MALVHSLTLEQSQKLEMQQKRSLAVILGSEYKSYSHSLTLTSLPRLDLLRSEACLKWARAAQLNPLHTDLFPLNTCQIQTRNKKTFDEYRCRTTKSNPLICHLLLYFNKNKHHQYIYVLVFNRISQKSILHRQFLYHIDVSYNIDQQHLTKNVFFVL